METLGLALALLLLMPIIGEAFGKMLLLMFGLVALGLIAWGGYIALGMVASAFAAAGNFVAVHWLAFSIVGGIYAASFAALMLMMGPRQFGQLLGLTLSRHLVYRTVEAD